MLVVALYALIGDSITMPVPIENRPFTAQCIEASLLLHVNSEQAQKIGLTPIGVFRSIGMVSIDGFGVFAGLKTVGNPSRRWAQEAILADKVLTRFPETIQVN